MKNLEKWGRLEKLDSAAVPSCALFFRQEKPQKISMPFLNLLKRYDGPQKRWRINLGWRKIGSMMPQKAIFMEILQSKRCCNSRTYASGLQKPTICWP